MGGYPIVFIGIGFNPILSFSSSLTLCVLFDRIFRIYSINQCMLFAENYGLASTQSLKNKDIPKGSAKGSISPS